MPPFSTCTAIVVLYSCTRTATTSTRLLLFEYCTSTRAAVQVLVQYSCTPYDKFEAESVHLEKMTTSLACSCINFVAGTTEQDALQRPTYSCTMLGRLIIAALAATLATAVPVAQDTRQISYTLRCAVLPHGLRHGRVAWPPAASWPPYI